ncbi:MAG: hypothetical protein R3C18_20775 [Planctomycetaceae bacterium]
MGWRERTAGHAIVTEVDFTLLSGLPKGVGFQALRHVEQTKPVSFIGTRDLGKNMAWPEGDDPFAEFAPDGISDYVEKVQVTAKAFCEAFDWLHGRMSELDPDFPIYGPSESVGELSLGMQIATLLECPVFSYLSDPDYLAEIACVSEPNSVVRVRCQVGPIHLRYEGGEVAAFLTTDNGPFGAIFNEFCDQTGVRKLEQSSEPGDQAMGFIAQELDRFVGVAIADPMHVTPDYQKEMSPIAQRTKKGGVKLLNNLT